MTSGKTWRPWRQDLREGLWDEGILGNQGWELPHPCSLTGHGYHREGAHTLPIM